MLFWVVPLICIGETPWISATPESNVDAVELIVMIITLSNGIFLNDILSLIELIALLLPSRLQIEIVLKITCAR